MSDLLPYLLERPVFLAPILLLAAMIVYAVLKRLVKAAVILAIAGGLYLLLVEYFGGGV